MLFWQFTIKTIDELDLVSNQNLSIEMFDEIDVYCFIKTRKKDLNKDENESLIDDNLEKINNNNLKKDPINQIKNISQEKKQNLKYKQR